MLSDGQVVRNSRAASIIKSATQVLPYRRELNQDLPSVRDTNRFGRVARLQI